MPIDKTVDSAKLDSALTNTADAIRRKTGLSQSIEFDLDDNKGFENAIDNIPSGGFNIDSVIEDSKQILYIEDSGTAGVFQVYHESGDVDFITGANLNTFAVPFFETYEHALLSAYITNIYKKDGDNWTLIEDGLDFSQTTIPSNPNMYAMFKLCASTEDLSLLDNITGTRLNGNPFTIGGLRRSTYSQILINGNSNPSYNIATANLSLSNDTLRILPYSNGHFCSPYFGSRWHYDIYAW